MNWLKHPLAIAAGVLLSILSLGYLGHEFYERWDVLGEVAPKGGEWLLLLLLGVGYGLALVLLAWNWRGYVIAVSGTDATDGLLIRSYTSSQIGKYLPGNVGHLVGRHLMLNREGVGHRQLGQALLLETVILLSAAGLAFAGAALFTPVTMKPLGLPMIGIAPFVPLGIFGLTLVLQRTAPKLWDQCKTCLLRWLGFGLLFMVSMTILYWLVLSGLTDEAPFAKVMTALLIAWVVGFLTPGAPGGLGTREATLLLLLKNHVDPQALLVSVALFRLVTVTGDMVCYSLPKLPWLGGTKLVGGRP